MQFVSLGLTHVCFSESKVVSVFETYDFFFLLKSATLFGGWMIRLTVDTYCRIFRVAVITFMIHHVQFEGSNRDFGPSPGQMLPGIHAVYRMTLGLFSGPL